MPQPRLLQPSQLASRGKRHPLLRATRVALALALLGFVVLQVHWRDKPVTNEDGLVVVLPGILSCLGGVDPKWLLTAFVVSIASIPVAALRWRCLLAVQDIHLSIGETIKLQFMGEFFSTVIPGMVGGDIVKAYCVMQKTTQKARVVVSVLVDRLVGVCGLVCMAVAMLAILHATRPLGGGLMRLSVSSVAVVLAASGAALAFLLSPRLRRLCGLQKIYDNLPFAAHLAHAGDAVRRYQAVPVALTRSFLLTLLAQFLNGAFIVLLGLALGVPVPWPHYFLYVPLILVLSAVPITPGGIGVTEELYLLFFAAAGNPSLVLALAVLVRATTLLSALPGGLAALFGGFSARCAK